MKALFWNIRGFGARGRRDQIHDLVCGEHIDILGLVETFKESFSPSELAAIAGMGTYDWHFLPASGHSGGILIGSKRDIFDFITFDHGIFWASCVVHHRQLNMMWEFMVVYGPADHLLTPLFLDEISSKIEACNIPLLIGGDFNLIHSPANKNNTNFSWPLPNAFNDFISTCALRELPRVGARFTWSNHQASPVWSMLDRVFVSDRWDSLFPRALLKARPAVGSDHVPLVLDAGILPIATTSRFQFDASWLLIEGFYDMLGSRITTFLSSPLRSFGPLDDWHKLSYELRKFLKGWSRNRAAEAHKEKYSLESQIRDLDLIVDSCGLSSSQWATRYALEDALLMLHHQSEIYWRQHGALNWTLKGDAMTAYFFAIANVRRRRCFIDSLLIDGVRISDQAVILDHIVDFYSNLLGSKPDHGVDLCSGFWDVGSTLSPNKNLGLMVPLSDEEIW